MKLITFVQPITQILSHMVPPKERLLFIGPRWGTSPFTLGLNHRKFKDSGKKKNQLIVLNSCTAHMG